MSEKKKPKTIKIRGNEYVTVNQRVLVFHDTYKNGAIITEMLSELGADRVFFKATVTPDTDKPQRFFTGYSQAPVGGNGVNKDSAWENAETSAVGRALGFMGIGIIEGIASADEVNKATSSKTVKQYNLQTPDYGVQQTGKPCAYCHKTHYGQYDKCRDCWQEEQATGVKKKKLPAQQPPVPTLEEQPF